MITLYLISAWQTESVSVFLRTYPNMRKRAARIFKDSYYRYCAKMHEQDERMHYLERYLLKLPEEIVFKEILNMFIIDHEFKAAFYLVEYIQPEKSNTTWSHNHWNLQIHQVRAETVKDIMEIAEVAIQQNIDCVLPEVALDGIANKINQIKW